MGGGLMQLVAYGAQNVYLNSNPQMTFFKVVFKRHTNFSIESIEQNFSGITDFGRKISCTISRKGDLLSQIFIEANLSIITQDVPRIGHQLIDWIELEIGGKLIDKHYGEWMDIWAQLTLDNSSWDRLDEMISAKLPVLNDIGNTKVYIPLYFWFCRNPGLALPLISLQSQEVKIHIQLNNREVIRNKYGVHLRSVDKIDKVSLFCDYIFLDRDERRRFTQASHEYLIEQVQFSNKISLCGNTAEVELNFNHPVKEIVWALNKKVVSVFQTTGGIGNDAIYSIKPTTDGGSIVTGKFYNTVIFGSTTLTSLGDSDIFVAKIDRYANWVWAVQAGGGLADGATILDITKDNGAMITGYFTGTAYFGQYILNGDTTSTDIFVAKISKNGLWQWATSAEGVGASDVALSLTINNDGTGIVSGAFRSNIAKFGNTTLINYYPGNESLFVAKISQFGYWIWANSAKGIAYALGTSNCNEGIYVSGGCASSKIEFTESIKINSDDNFVIPPNGTQPQWKWLKNVQANISDNLTEPMGIITPDSSGSIYITSYFKGIDISFNPYKLTSANGGTDESIVIGKLDIDGIWKWVYTDSSMNNIISRGNAIATDPSNNLYVTGYTKTDISSNPIIFVKKYNINGITLDTEWTTSFDVSSNSYGIIVNDDGIYISGWYMGQSSIIPMSNIVDESFFLAKLDFSGNWLWGRKIEAGTIVNGLSITDSNGIIYTSGYYDISASLYDSSGIYTTISPISVIGNIFIANINKDGDWISTRYATCNISVLPIALTSDISGNVYISGFCKDTCYFNGDSITYIEFTTIGQNDIFVAKLDTSGSWNWVQTAGGPDFNSNNSLRITCDELCNVYISGFHEGTCNYYIDNVDIDIYTSTSPINYIDLFTAKIDTSGNWKWAATAGGGLDYQINNILGISIDKYGILSFIGYFYSEYFEYGSSIYSRLSNSPQADLFIAKMNAPSESPVDPIQPTFESSRMYIAKLSNDGQWLWAIAVKGHINIYKILCMNDGVAIAGTLQDNDITIGSTIIHVSPIAPESVMTFVAKLSHEGNWLWAIQPETELSTYPYDLIVTLDNGLLLTGTYDYYISFGNILLEDDITNIYVAKISPDAYWEWAVSSGQELSNTKLSLTTLSDGYFLLAGGLTGDGVNFGMHNMNDTGSYADIFIAKLSPNGEWITSIYNNMYTSAETPILNYWGDDGTDLVNKAVIKLNGLDRFQEREGTYFRCVQPYQHHQNSKQDPDKFLGGFYIYSFALNPEEHQPSGSCNFSRIDDKVMFLKLSDNVKSIKVWALNYNVLRIMSGMAGLAYTN